MEKHTTTAKSKITRRNYSRISGSLELPNLVEIQTNSYKWFKEVGIKEVFDDIYPITNFNETLSLEFVDCAFDEPKYSVNESKDRDANYAAPIRATLRLINSGTGEIKEQEVFMGDFPLMTDSGTFIINGAERVIVSQLVRSPGAYFADAIDKSGKTVFEGSIIPSRGTWLEFENDAKDVLNVRIDRNRKIPGTVLLRALGLSSNEDIIKEVTTQKEKMDENGELTKFKYNIRVNEKSYLYAHGNESDTKIYIIKVNGETVTIPWINDHNNAMYAYRYDNGIINLGEYENQDVEIEGVCYQEDCNLKFATLPLEKFENFVTNYKENTTKEIKIENNKIKIKVENAKAGQKLFLPITYDAGWTGVNNGENTSVNRIFNTYISLDLKEGTNEIELTFIPAKMKLGIELSVVTLIIILIYTFGIKRIIKKDGILDKIIVNLGFGLYIIITAGFFIKVYWMCIVQTIKQWIG